LVNNVELLIRLAGELSLFYSKTYSSFSFIYLISTVSELALLTPIYCSWISVWEAGYICFEDIVESGNSSILWFRIAFYLISVFLSGDCYCIFLYSKEYSGFIT